MRLSRSLITFAFVAESFSRTGDIASGFEPLFAPILDRHKGENFDPDLFAKEVSEMWGCLMHPYVALDLAAKMAHEGLLHPLTKEGTVVGYRILDKGITYPAVKEEQIAGLMGKFFEFARGRASVRAVQFSDEELENALSERLITMEFLAIASRDQPSYLRPKTLALKKSEAPEEATDPSSIRQAQLDYLCADFVDQLARNEPESFELLADVSCGALLAEVVLGLRTPPQTGQDASGLTVCLDAPFIMDLLGLTAPAAKTYADLLFESAKRSQAKLCCFVHNIEEIEANIDAPMANLQRHTEVFGPTGRMLLQGAAMRAFVVSVRRDVRSAVAKLGIKIIDQKFDDLVSGLKYYSYTQEDALASHLGTYQNIYARLRDAASIANVIRLRGDRQLTATLFGSRSVFVTGNPRLATRANSYLARELRYSNESFPPVITDRFFAGVLWVAQGGKGLDIPRRKLLANCTRAMIPRRDIITKMHNFLAQIDAQKAQHFDALIANDRCAFYLMEQTLGDRDLLTLENCQTIYENIERATAEKVAAEKETEIVSLTGKHTQEVEELRAQAVAERDRATADREQLRTEIGALGSVIDDLLQTQAQEREAARKRDERALAQCIAAGRQAARRFVVYIAGAFAIGSAGLMLTYELLKISVGSGAVAYGVYTVVGLLLLAAVAFVGFWQIPDFVFGEALTRRRKDAFQRKAEEFGVAFNAGDFDIDWVRGSARSVGRSEQSG